MSQLRHGRKFTEDEVRTIRRKVAEGVSRRELALSFSVNLGTLDRLVRRETYGWVADVAGPPQGVVPLPKEVDDAWERLMAEQQKMDKERAKVKS